MGNNSAKPRKTDNFDIEGQLSKPKLKFIKPTDNSDQKLGTKTLIIAGNS